MTIYFQEILSSIFLLHRHTLGQNWYLAFNYQKMRTNLIRATFEAFKKLNSYKVKTDFEKKSGMTTGKVE
jgi:hypothetical protein